MEILGTIIVCFLIADFATGVFHWIEDTYGLPTWPVLGEYVIKPNIDHHKQPGLIGRMGTWISRNVQPLILAIGGVGILWFLGMAGWPAFLVGILAALGNEVHCWSHRKNNPRWIMWLQGAGVVQNPRQHALHHLKPYDEYYCTLGNFMNEVLFTLKFWRGLEWVLLKTFGITVKRLDARRDGY